MSQALIARLLGVAVVFAGLALAGATVRAQSLPVPALSARITDTTGTLDAAAVQRIEAPLTALEADKGSQIAVLVVPTTGTETIEQYALRAFEQWKLGRQGVDDGVLLVVARNDRTVRIEVGYGLEGAIPDVAAYRVIQEYLVPRFREGDFAGGIEAAVAALAKLVQGEELPAPMAEPASDGLPFDLGALIFLTLLGAVGSRNLFGRTPRALRALLSGAAAAALCWFSLSPPWLAVLAAGVVGFFIGMLTLEVGRYARSGGFGGVGGGSRGGGWSGGGSSGGGGGWSGGGGRSGGGGASGSW